MRVKITLWQFAVVSMKLESVAFPMGDVRAELTDVVEVDEMCTSDHSLSGRSLKISSFSAG